LSGAAPNPAVLSRLFLSAVLPCLTDLVAQDVAARQIFGTQAATIGLKVLGGPKAYLAFDQGLIRWTDQSSTLPSVLLIFFSDAHLNAFFSGKKWAVPLLAWGGWRIGVLKRFSKLAALLERVLNGEPEVLSTPEGRRLHTRLSLIAAGLGLQTLAGGDPAAISTLRGLPKGLAAFSIEGESDATVWFEHGGSNKSGWSDPPRLPDVRIAFSDINIAYAAMRDEADTMAAVGGGGIKIDGLIPLADGLNFVMERMRVYLQP
jgi:hypothetical protein